jgi:SWI/SNF-related matrix-associated actin-dependent regulator of chromatin subfamily A member 5
VWCLEKEITIYVGLREMQRNWYRSVLEKDIDAVNGTVRLARYRVIYLTLFFLYRSNCEGGQDASD